MDRTTVKFENKRGQFTEVAGSDSRIKYKHSTFDRAGLKITGWFEYESGEEFQIELNKLFGEYKNQKHNIYYDKCYGWVK